MKPLLLTIALLFSTPAWADLGNIVAIFSMNNILLFIVIILVIALAFFFYFFFLFARNVSAIDFIRVMQREIDMQTTQETEIFVAALTAQADSLTLRLHALQSDEFKKRYRDLLRRIETDEFIPSIEVLEKENPLRYFIEEVNYPGGQIDLDGSIINFDDDFSLLETACFYIKHLTPENKKIEWLSVAWFDTFGLGGVNEKRYS